MDVKVIFIGNPLGGDDGIGPYLYNVLKDHPLLAGYDLLELGVIGLDMISYVEDDDRLIIVDAVHSEADAGRVSVIQEKELPKAPLLVSAHDFGVEQTAEMLRLYKPGLKSINVIGISVRGIRAFSNQLSDELLDRIGSIKQEVLDKIVFLAKGG